MTTLGVASLLILLTIEGIKSLSCPSGKYPIYIPSGSYILNISQVAGSPTATRKQNVDTSKECQEQCDAFTQYECKSFSISQVNRQCILYPVVDNEPGVTKTNRADMNYFKGICSNTPDLDQCQTLVEKVDLAFVVDGSGSICDDDPTRRDEDLINKCDNWISMKTFIKQIVSRLDIGPTKTRVAMVTFANTGRVVFNFTSYTTENELKRAIDGLEYPGGNTDTYGGLYLMRTELFEPSTTGRNQIAFIITDGKATVNKNLTAPEINDDQSRGIIMFAVGITNNIDEPSLSKLSSPPHLLDRNYFRSPNFNTLGPVVSELLKASCIRPNPKFYGTTTTVAPATPVLGFKDLLEKNPAYIVLLMMGVVVIGLFLIAILLLCYY